MVDVDPYAVLVVLLLIAAVYLWITMGYPLSDIVNSKVWLFGWWMLCIGIMFSVYKMLLISGG